MSSDIIVYAIGDNMKLDLGKKFWNHVSGKHDKVLIITDREHRLTPSLQFIGHKERLVLCIYIFVRIGCEFYLFIKYSQFTSKEHIMAIK